MVCNNAWALEQDSWDTVDYVMFVRTQASHAVLLGLAL